MSSRQSSLDFRPETLRGAEGFVRVGQSRASQWWFCDPKGRPFFSCGVTSIGRTRPPGVGPAGRLRAWHVNTVGPWGIPASFDPSFYRTEVLEFRKALPEAVIRIAGALLPDVFDKRWVAACDALATRRCLPLCENTSLLGYFTDHELGWAQPDGEPARLQARPDPAGVVPPPRPSLLQVCLSLEPSHAAYHAAWEFALSAHGGDLAALGRAWELPLKNKEVLRQRTRADTPVLAALYLDDNARFSREFARAYFKTCADAVRKSDANHLLLGCRFAGMPGAAVLSECVYPHVDVLSLNDSRNAPGPRLDACAGQGARPVLLGGFSWVNDYFTGHTGAGAAPGLTRVESMLSKGRTALAQVIAHPAAVGYAWHPWMDAAGQQPPFAQGLVHVDGGEAVEHTDLLSSINARAESLRCGASPHETISAAFPGPGLRVPDGRVLQESRHPA